MISTDRTMFLSQSSVQARTEKYAAAAGEMDVIVFALKKLDLKSISKDALSIYPTNSSSKLLYIRDAVKIARTLPRPDVITAQDPFEAGLAALYIARHFNVPLHIQIHTNFSASSFISHHWPLNAIRLLLAGYVLSRATRIRTVSNKIREGILKNYHLTIPVSVLPIFVDTLRFKNTLVPETLSVRFQSYDKKILVVSRLEREKGVEMAIRALAEASIATSCLIILGEGRERERLEEEAKHLNISSQVFFEGRQDPAAYYKLADVVLFPSDSYDGYGMVIIEALVAGTPVIATDVGIARDAGAIVVPIEDFPKTLTSLLSGSKEQARLLDYPYGEEAAYVREWVADIAAK